MRPYVMQFHERPLTLVKFNYDGDFFLTCGKDGEVNLVRTDTCERIGSYAPPGDKSGAVYAVDVTFDSKYVVTGGADGKLIIYTFEGEMKSNISHGGILKYVEFNQKPGEQNMVVTCNDKFKSTADGSIPNRIMIWQCDFTKPQPVKKLLSIENELPMKATKVKWGPFDQTLIAIFEEGTVCIFDSNNGERVDLIQAHQGPCTGLNFNADRTLMITCSKDNYAKLWTTDNYECAKTYKTDRQLNDVCISPLYNKEKDKRCHIMMGGGQDAKDVTTTGSSSGKFEALLWNMVNEEEIGSVKTGFGPINTIAFTQDGRGFVTGGEDGFVRLYNFDAEYFTNDKYE